MCWLFADRSDRYFNGAWSKGIIRDWKGLSKKNKRTCTLTQKHLQAYIAYGKIISTILPSNVACWRHRLQQANTVVNNSGYFVYIIVLISKYDPVLKSVI